MEKEKLIKLEIEELRYEIELLKNENEFLKTKNGGLNDMISNLKSQLIIERCMRLYTN